MGLETEKYMLFTSYKRDGSTVSLPVWLVPFGEGQVAFYTGADSLKVKRISRNPAVKVQACDARGKKTHGPVVDGTARLASPEEYADVRARVKAKYGFMTAITRTMATVAAKVRGQKDFEYGSAAIVVTLAS